MEDCIFCKIVSKEIPSQIIYENNKVIAFPDIAPANPGHILVVPKEHHKDLLETPDDVMKEVFAVVKKVAKASMKVMEAKGFNS